MRCQTTLKDSGKIESLETTLGFLHIKDATPIRLSLQYEAERHLPLLRSKSLELQLLRLSGGDKPRSRRG